MKLQPYPEYKDSGVPWLGEIPQHWQALPNRALFNEVNARNHPEEPLLSVTISKGVIRQTDLLANTSKKDSSNENKANYKLVQPRDIAYNKMRAWQGAVGVSNYRGIVSPAYIVVRLRGEQNPEYFHYLLRTPAFAKEAERWSYGITSDQWSLRAEDFKQIYCALPPKEEQDAIAALLAYADRRTNRIIRTKRRLIELLNEQKQVIIHRAVTRGLDPNVRLKPSGIDWLGDVPEGWEVMALRMRYSVQLGKMLDTKRITGSHLVPYLRNTDVQWDGINSTNLPMMDIPEREYERYLVKPGDLLVCEGGDVGRSAFWDDALPMCGYQKALHRLRPTSNGRECPRFLFYVLFAASKRGIFIADGSENTIAHLTAEKLRRHRFAFPPKTEQEAIALHLDTTLNDLEQAVERANHTIDLLREYRTRLIADVVTGKLDVVDVELPALDEIEAPEDWETDEDNEADEMDEMEGVTA